MRDVVQSAVGLAAGVAPWVPGQGRYGLDSLTPQDFTTALAGSVPGAAVQGLRVEIDSRGTTDRARIHLEWNEAGRSANLPATAFAKGTSSQVAPRAIVSGFGCHTYETRFFEQIQPSVADLTITPFVRRSGRGGRYVIAFEDLGLRPGGVTFYDADSECPRSHAEQVVELLATLHGRFWESPRFRTDLAWLETYSRRPGGPFMRWLFTWSEKRFMKQDREVPDAVRRLTKRYVENQQALIKVWEAMPVTLAHGDCHLGNTYGTAEGGAGIYDWQVFHKMNGLRDLAYFLMHSIPTELRRAEQENLVRRYLDVLAASGAGSGAPSYAEALDAVRLLAVDGWIAIVFSLAAGGMQPDDRMEVTAERAVASLLDLDTEAAIDAVL